MKEDELDKQNNKSGYCDDSSQQLQVIFLLLFFLGLEICLRCVVYV